ncbi:MAG: hypothetical protein ACFFCM_16025 [Promethearchaeota archaeon]
MQLFKIDKKGKLIELSQLEFTNNDVYIVDDQKVIYIWVGLESSQDKKDNAAEIARKFDKERGNEAKLLIMKQNREYGSFLAMMDDLKKGLLPGINKQRRAELNLEKPESSHEEKSDVILKNEEVSTTEKNIAKWFEQLKKYRKYDITVSKVGLEERDLEDQIRDAAYYLSLENYSYNDLCWMLAEKILKYTLRMPSIEDIKKKAEDVFISSCTYDELCWLNAEMDILIQKEYIKKDIYNFDVT